MWAGRVGQRVAGFATLKPQTSACDELHLVGVESAWHGRGLGRALVETVAAFSRSRGAALLSVKTLGEAHPDPHYAATRAFYRACGFLPVETFTQLWGADTPCLLLAKPLAPESNDSVAPRQGG